MDEAKFSSSGTYLATCGADGRLKIWDTQTSSLKHEFTPSSHLTANCSCLEWAPFKKKHSKKRKKTVQNEMIVMGTGIGSLIFYNVTQGEVQAQSKGAHSGKVTGLTWNIESLYLYSCGEDGLIVEWDPEIPSIIRRWTASKNGLSSIQVFQSNLLAAGQSITLWDLKSKTAIKSFTGHPNQVKQIESIADSSYFITMGYGERFLKIWSVSEKNSIATLAIPESAQFFSVLPVNGQVIISTVTQKGQLYIFQHKLNGPVKKSISPACSLRIVEATDTSKTVYFLTSFVVNGSEKPAVIGAYGSWVDLRFESFEISDIEKEKIIEREYTKTKKSKGKNAQQAVVEVPNDVKHLQPGTDYSSAGGSTNKIKKRKQGESSDKSTDNGELPMEDRLTNLTLGSTSTGIRENNLAHLLSQGLHSKDVRILHSVLSRWDEEVITNTIRSLPIQLVVPFLTEAKKMLAGKAQLNNSILKWIKIVLQVHSSYLMCCPSTEDLLSPFMSLLHTREILYPKMCQLKGKLSLIRAHIQAKAHRTEPTNEALLVFNDDSENEEDENDMIPSDSEAFLSTDELGVEDDSSLEENEAEDSSANEESDENISEAAEPSALNHFSSSPSLKSKADRNQKSSSKNAKRKVVDEDSGPESMDEDA